MAPAPTKPIALAAALILLALSPTSAHGQQSTTSTPLAEDSADDVSTVLSGEATTSAGTAPSNVDFIGLSLAENSQELTLSLELASLESSQPQAGADIQIHFAVGDQPYLIDVRVPSTADAQSVFPDPGLSAQLRRVLDDAGGSDLLGPVETSPVGSTILELQLNRTLLLDEVGAPLLAGRILSNWYVTSTSRQYSVEVVDPDTAITYEDRMPDNGVGHEYSIQFGERESTPILLSSVRPQRASNGEEGAFLFSVIGRNTEHSSIEFALQAANAPEGWRVEFPVAGAALAPEARQEFPVIINTPFRHDHGSTESVSIQAVALSDNRVLGERALSIYYLDPAQPAGHHSELFLHTRYNDNPTPATMQGEGGGVGPYMNTNPDDEADTSEPIGPTEFVERGLPQSYHWCIPLSPSLELGLALDHGTIGTLELAMHSQTGMSGSLHGELLVRSAKNYPGFDATSTCSDTPVQPVAQVADQQMNLPFGGDSVPVSAQIQARPDLDVVPSRPYQNLVLHLQLDVADVGSVDRIGVPVIEPGASMELPLLEYQDPAKEVLEATSGFLEVVAESYARAPPGTEVAFEVRLAEPSAEVSMFGTKTAWATLHATPDRTEWLVLVKVPEDAASQETADLLINARTPDGETGLVRLQVVVDDTARPPDTSLELDKYFQEREAPLPFLMGVAGVVLVGIRLRRNRRC